MYVHRDHPILIESQITLGHPASLKQIHLIYCIKLTRRFGTYNNILLHTQFISQAWPHGELYQSIDLKDELLIFHRDILILLKSIQVGTTASSSNYNLYHLYRLYQRRNLQIPIHISY